MYLKHNQCLWVFHFFSQFWRHSRQKRETNRYSFCAFGARFEGEHRGNELCHLAPEWRLTHSCHIRGLVVATLLLRSLFIHALERIMIKSGVQWWQKQLDSLLCLMLDLLLFIQRHKQLDWRASRQSAPSFSREKDIFGRILAPRRENHLYTT